MLKNPKTQSRHNLDSGQPTLKQTEGLQATQGKCSSDVFRRMGSSLAHAYRFKSLNRLARSSTVGTLPGTVPPPVLLLSWVFASWPPGSLTFGLKLSVRAPGGATETGLFAPPGAMALGGVARESSAGSNARPMSTFCLFGPGVVTMVLCSASSGASFS